MKPIWTDEQERALKAFRRAYEDDGLTPWSESRFWRVLCWFLLAAVGVEAVVIAALVLGWRLS